MSNEKEIDGSHLDNVFKQIGYLFASGSVMVGGALITKHADQISPEFSQVSFLTGIILAFIGLGLSAWTGMYGVQEITKYYRSRVKGFCYGGLYLFFAVQIALGAFHAATTKPDDKEQHNKSIHPTADASAD